MSTGAYNIESVKALLLNQRAELRARLAALQAELRREAEPLSPDFAEQSTQRENEDVAESLRRGTEAELNHIDRAYRARSHWPIRHLCCVWQRHRARAIAPRALCRSLWPLR